MIAYSMRDPAWENRTIGKTKLTIGSEGCFLTSIAMIVEKRPDELNDFFTLNGCYTPDGRIINLRAARLLGYDYYYLKNNPKKLSIGETNYFAKDGYDQHFFVDLGNGNIVDSLTGEEGENPYMDKMVSWRVLEPKKA